MYCRAEDGVDAVTIIDKAHACRPRSGFCHDRVGGRLHWHRHGERGPADLLEGRSTEVGGLLDVLANRTRTHRSAVPVEEFRAERAIKNIPVLRGSPDSAPESPLGPLSKLTPAGEWPVHLMLPVDGAGTVGLPSVSRNASPFNAL